MREGTWGSARRGGRSKVRREESSKRVNRPRVKLCRAFSSFCFSPLLPSAPLPSLPPTIASSSFGGTPRSPLHASPRRQIPTTRLSNLFFPILPSPSSSASLSHLPAPASHSSRRAQSRKPRCRPTAYTASQQTEVEQGIGCESEDEMAINRSYNPPAT